MSIMRCEECGDYTLKEEHCDKETVSTHPPKFSFPDEYGKYRRVAKRKEDDN